MNKPKGRTPGTATPGLVEGIMQAVDTYIAEMGMKAPQRAQDGPTTAGPTKGPGRRRKGQGTDSKGEGADAS